MDIDKFIEFVEQKLIIDPINKLVNDNSIPISFTEFKYIFKFLHNNEQTSKIFDVELPNEIKQLRKDMDLYVKIIAYNPNTNNNYEEIKFLMENGARLNGITLITDKGNLKILDFVENLGQELSCSLLDYLLSIQTEDDGMQSFYGAIEGLQNNLKNYKALIKWIENATEMAGGSNTTHGDFM